MLDAVYMYPVEMLTPVKTLVQLVEPSLGISS
jgi:hypothetical protein